jgi:hypothetical protein
VARSFKVALLLLALFGAWRWHVGKPRPEPGMQEAPMAASAGTPQKHYEVEGFDADYGRAYLQGWSVRVARELYEKDAALAQAALALLDRKLADIGAAVPPPRIDDLRAIPIWLEARDPGLRGLQYHWSADWLRANGYNPAKARAVEIAEADTFLQWERDQPWFVLHELAHGLHDRVLGGDNAQVQRAFANAQAQGLYQSVRRNNGATERAYALTNDKEYFAELSEAYFGVNDFYPFNRKELREYDPVGFALMESVWQAR